MTLRAAGLAGATALLLADFQRAEGLIDGHGCGHGIGLSQYGAMGYAGQEGRGFRWILGHYYSGTRVRRVHGGRVRVRLLEARAVRVRSASVATGAGGRRVRLKRGV